MALVEVKKDSAKGTDDKFSKISPKLAEKAKDDLKTVKGVFRIYESGREGCNEKITCKKYPVSVCPKFERVMTDGQTYEIPLYVARFLNGIDSCAENLNGKIHTCSFPTHGWRVENNQIKTSEIGFGDLVNPHLEVVKRTRRYGFESLEFNSSSL